MPEEMCERSIDMWYGVQSIREGFCLHLNYPLCNYSQYFYSFLLDSPLFSHILVSISFSIFDRNTEGSWDVGKVLTWWIRITIVVVEEFVVRVWRISNRTFAKMKTVREASVKAKVKRIFSSRINITWFFICLWLPSLSIHCLSPQNICLLCSMRTTLSLILYSEFTTDFNSVYNQWQFRYPAVPLYQ